MARRPRDGRRMLRTSAVLGAAVGLLVAAVWLGHQLSTRYEKVSGTVVSSTRHVTTAPCGAKGNQVCPTLAYVTRVRVGTRTVALDEDTDLAGGTTLTLWHSGNEYDTVDPHSAGGVVLVVLVSLLLAVGTTTLVFVPWFLVRRPPWNAAAPGRPRGTPPWPPQSYPPQSYPPQSYPPQSYPPPGYPPT